MTDKKTTQELLGGLKDDDVRRDVLTYALSAWAMGSVKDVLQSFQEGDEEDDKRNARQCGDNFDLVHAITIEIEDVLMVGYSLMQSRGFTYVPTEREEG